MNSSSKVPPRFVPTLTEVVQPEAAALEDTADSAQSASPEQSHGAAQQVLGPRTLGDSVVPLARPSFHTSWLADGLYGRGRPAGIPHQLPPLPESLPPQQSFAQSMAGQVEPEIELVTAELVEAFPLADQAEQPSVTDAGQPQDEELQPGSEVLDEEAAEPLVQVQDVEQAVEPAPVFGAAGLQQALDEHGAVVAEEYLVHRLMQRVDLVLEHKLKEAIAQVVEAQTRSMVLRLREEVETVVRQSVYEAVEAELAQQAQARQ
ncbi:hypothetical protein P245_03600 [Comamonas thiooxydans]|uniref:Uncharacterized protein n=1 Tax=Comamonas thiooxydans TaxID=363952 RepID=A0A0E3BK12_9BURK|nr:hypothetical protein [Comamonas thiooxydans]KGG98942.1 hypothetical protein P245_03600 [Comamonas thiooxydans]